METKVKAQITPGPWEQITKPNGPCTDRYIIGGGDRHVYIATIESESAHSRYGYNAPKQDAEANALAIAAVPDLIKALQRAIGQSYVESDGAIVCTYCTYRAEIGQGCHIHADACFVPEGEAALRKAGML